MSMLLIDLSFLSFGLCCPLRSKGEEGLRKKRVEWNSVETEGTLGF